MLGNTIHRPVRNPGIGSASNTAGIGQSSLEDALLLSWDKDFLYAFPPISPPTDSPNKDKMG